MTNVARTDPAPAVRHTEQTTEEAYDLLARQFLADGWASSTFRAWEQVFRADTPVADAMTSRALAVVR